MMKNLLIISILWGTFVHASSVPAYQKFSSYESLKPDVKVGKGLSFDINYAGILALVDERFQKDYFVNAPKRLKPLESVLTLSYRF